MFWQSLFGDTAWWQTDRLMQREDVGTLDHSCRRAFNGRCLEHSPDIVTMKNIFALGLLLLVIPATVLGHTKLAASVPEDGAQIATANEIRLEFSAPVRLTAVKVQNRDGTEISLGDIPTETQEAFTVAVKEALGPGQYQVSWRSISGDSHVVNGEFRFTVTG